jgi:hypothetical protein
VPATGAYKLLIRYPGDPKKQTTTSGQLVVQQGGTPLANATVNFQANTQQWNEVARPQLAGGSPCQVIFTQPQPPPATAMRLPFVEVCLEPVP